MKKILVLVDGFNFYHRLKDYQYKNKVCVKWLNYAKLIKLHFTDYDDYDFEYIYFSAKAKFRGKETTTKHETYIKALETENIKSVLGNFKKKLIPRCKCDEKCTNCSSEQDRTKLVKHEEKNTDVNIAITLVEKALLKEYDKCYILSSDSDFNTAIERAKEIHPTGIITLVPPPLSDNKNRKNKYYISGIKNLTKTNPLFVSWESIKKAQFPDTLGDLINPWIIS